MSNDMPKYTSLKLIQATNAVASGFATRPDRHSSSNMAYLTQKDCEHIAEKVLFELGYQNAPTR